MKHSSKTVIGSAALVLPTVIAASAVAATVVGTAGDDVLHGTPQADTIFGEAGNDEIWSGRGPDRVVGGTGSDTIHSGRGNDWIQADLARLGRGGGDDVVYAGRGDDVVHAAGGTNLIVLGYGNDWVSDLPNDRVDRDDVIYMGRAAISPNSIMVDGSSALVPAQTWSPCMAAPRGSMAAAERTCSTPT